jgi:hypothetical protein
MQATNAAPDQLWQPRYQTTGLRRLLQASEAALRDAGLKTDQFGPDSMAALELLAASVVSGSDVDDIAPRFVSLAVPILARSSSQQAVLVERLLGIEQDYLLEGIFGNRFRDAHVSPKSDAPSLQVTRGNASASRSPALPLSERIRRGLAHAASLTRDAVEHLLAMLIQLRLFTRRNEKRARLIRKNVSNLAARVSLSLDTVQASSAISDLRRTAIRASNRVARITKRLDANRTLRATIRAGGIFHPIFRRKQVATEYLFLVRQLSNVDLEHARIRALLQELQVQGMPLVLYPYRGDPRRVFDTLTAGRRATLDLRELHDRHPNARLVVVSEGRDLVNSFTLDPHGWASQLQQWPRRALITPLPSSSWGTLESNIHYGLGFSLSSSREHAFDQLDHLLGGSTPVALFADDGPRGLIPMFVASLNTAFVSEEAPRDDELRALLLQLRLHLGQEGFEWLGVCAFFPAMTPELTLHYGRRLFAGAYRSLDFDDTFARLAALPWMRYGAMPYWARRLVVDGLSDEQKTAARQIIASTISKTNLTRATPTAASRRFAKSEGNSKLALPIRIGDIGSGGGLDFDELTIAFLADNSDHELDPILNLSEADTITIVSDEPTYVAPPQQSTPIPPRLAELRRGKKVFVTGAVLAGHGKGDLLELLEAGGYQTVRRDDLVDDPSTSLEQVLSSVAAVVVLWGENSAESGNVIAEATVGLEQNKLLQVYFPSFQIDRVPAQFRRYQAISLSNGKAIVDALDRISGISARGEEKNASHRIYISHTRETNAEAKALQEWLAAQGWNNIFIAHDPEAGIRAGDDWQDAITRAVHRTEVMICIASRAWMSSRWAQEEIRLAQHLGKRVIIVSIEHEISNEFSSDSAVEFINLARETRDYVVTISFPTGAPSVEVRFSSEGLNGLHEALQWDPRSARIFIAYARKDGAEFATDLRDSLLGEGFSIWQDVFRLEGGRDWRSQLEEALKSKACQHLVLVVTPAALASDVVRLEIRLARQEGKTVCSVKGPGLTDLAPLPRWLGQIYDLDLPERYAMLRQVLQDPSRQRRVPMMAPEPPTNFVRPAAFSTLKEQLLDIKGDAVTITSALHGAGGYGKTTLAMALAHDPDIQDGYFDGILWAQLGERPDGLSIISDLVETLSGERSGLQDINSAAAKLSETLGDRRILLVVDDVWREEDLRPFMQGGPNVTRLITTRNESVLPSNILRQTADAISGDDAPTLLTTGLPRDQVQANRSELTALARRLGGRPLLLRLVNGFLRDRIASGALLRGAIDAASKRFDEWGPRAFGLADDQINHKPTFFGAEIARLEGHSESVTSICLLADGRLASGSFDRTIRVWDLMAATETACLRGHTGPVTALCVLPGGPLASGSDDNTIRLWDLSTGAVIARLEGRPGWALCALPDGRLASGSSDNAINLWDIATGAKTARLEGHSGQLNTLCVVPGGRLASGSDDSTIRLWDIATGREIARITVLSYRVTALCMLPDGHLASGSDDNNIRFWDLTTNMEVARLEGHASSINALCLLPGGPLASASDDNTIRLWDISRGAETARLEGHTDWVNALCVLPDGRLGSGSSDNTIRLWGLGV